MATVERQITYVEEKKNCNDEFCLCRFSSFFEHTVDEYCEDCNEHEWSWDTECLSPATLLSHHNHEVRFHPGYSSGTAAVRGNQPLQKGNIYYWEIKMLTSLYGTDVMVGVGTMDAELHKHAYQFCSLLGSDKESWGFSYTGRLHHNDKFEWYGPPYGKGSVVGIYLDMWKGTLEFFVDRSPLGIAFKSLGNKTLYPMVCSTAAQSGMRVTLSVSHPVSLKLLALQALDGSQETLKQLLQVPGLRRYVSNYWWLLGRRDETRSLIEIADQSRCKHLTCKHQAESGSARRLCVMCDIIL